MPQTSPEINLDPSVERKLLGGLLIALLVISGMVAIAIKNNARQAESAGWVNHARDFILETDAILSSLNAAETAQRTHIIVGDNDTKQAAADAFTRIAEHLDVAKQLAFESPTQVQRLNRLQGLLQRQIDWNKESIQRRAQGTAAAMSVFTNAQTRANMAEIQREIRDAKNDENLLLQQREQKLTRHTRLTELILYTGIGVNFFLLAFGFYIVRRDLNLRRRAAAALKEANEMLEEKVKLRTAELATALDKLQIENLEQKWGQAALQRLVGHHELLLNAIRDAIFVVSRTGKIISSNSAAADLAEREPSQLTGHSITSFVLEHKTSGLVTWKAHFLSEPVKTGLTKERISAYLKKPNGTVIPIRVSCFPTRETDNATGAVITIYSGV